MEQNDPRRLARLTSFRSQAQERECNQDIASTPTNSQAHVMSQHECIQPMPPPFTNSEANSSLLIIPRGLTNQHLHIPQNIHELEPLLALQHQFSNFWAQQYQEAQDTVHFRTHPLPLSSIKRIMKMDEDVKMVSTDACIVFAKACEFFIKDLTMRSWAQAENSRRWTLQRSDIASAISWTDEFGFLVDVVPKDKTMGHNVHSVRNTNMEQNDQRRSARLASFCSQAQGYECNQDMALTSSNTQAHVISQHECTQPMPLPLTNFEANSSLLIIPRDPTNQHLHIPQNICEPEPLLALQCQLSNFWAQQYQEAQDTIDFRTHPLPLSSIKRIMKMDEDVRVVSTDACIVFAKACEFFIKNLTMRSWAQTKDNRRQTLQRNDIASAIAQTDEFDFLMDVVPKDETIGHNVYTDIDRASESAKSESAKSGRIDPNYHPMPLPPRNVMGPPYGHHNLIMGKCVPNQAHVGNIVTHSTVALECPQQQQNDASPSSDEN